MPDRTWVLPGLSGINPGFPGLSPTSRHVRNALLARSPLYSEAEASFRARLACFIHAASVRAEPGSNSSIDFWCRPPESGVTSKKADPVLRRPYGYRPTKRSSTPPTHTTLKAQELERGMTRQRRPPVAKPAGRYRGCGSLPSTEADSERSQGPAGAGGLDRDKVASRSTH